MKRWLLASLLFYLPTFVVLAENNDQCGLYLAISSTSTVDETKWGIYAGKEIDQGQPIGHPEVAVNLFNMQANAGLDEVAEGDEVDEDQRLVQEAIDFFEQFIWVPVPAGAQFELEEGRAVTAIPGAGVLGGYNPSLTNADWNSSAAYVRSSQNEVVGESHPGRGAYSNFYDVVLRSTTKIPAGREIFLDYGDNWEAEHEEEQLEADDYKKMDETVEKMKAFFEKYDEDLNEKAKREIYDFLIRDVMNAAVGQSKARKIQEALPNHPDLLEQVLNRGGSYSYSQPHSQRDQEWLDTHGRCMDHIKPGPSTIPHAGRGAFATRDIKAGQLITPVPLVQIPMESLLDMYDIATDDENGESYYRLSEEVTGQQLLYNYCYGHPESSMLLFPTGHVSALINHDHKSPNAKMTWSEHPAHQKHWYDLSPEELLKEENLYIGLLMEVVALRDIAAGEEILMDYGPEWQQAWEEHEASWKESVADGTIPSEWPIRALDLNQMYQDDPHTYKFKTQEQLATEPYPDNVLLKCLAVPKEQKEEDHHPKMQEGLMVLEWKDDDANRIFDANDDIFDCQVLKRKEVKSKGDQETHLLYTVKRSKDEEDPDLIIEGVPHEAMFFVDKPETGDQFFQSAHAFRHYIGIPDDVFPQGPWRNAVEE